MARNDSSPGTLIANFSSDPSRLPMVRSEKPAESSPSYSASAAAIFIGWTSVITFPWKSPETATPSALTRATTAPLRRARR